MFRRYLAFGAALLAVGIHAQDLVQDQSFGYGSTLSPNSFTIPGWSMFGDGHVPQLLSDKVILTPPYGGNKKGALWQEKQNNLQQWTVEVDFRAGGEERGRGDLTIWYVKDGTRQVSANSIYSAGTFDGLAIVVDTVGGVQKIRGFLNDGSKDHRNHDNVDSLAFGHCDYNYRNLGRPSKLRLTSTDSGFSVQIDDRDCFSSSQVNLPHDYTFGLTASSADPPDSFEVFKFLLRPSTPAFDSPQQPNTDQRQQQFLNTQPPRAQLNQNQQQQSPPQPDDTPASFYKDTQSQFEDVHSRLYSLSKTLTSMYSDLQRLSSESDTHHAALLARLPSTFPSSSQQNTNNPSGPALSELSARLQRLENLLTDLTHADHKGSFERIERQIAQTHSFVGEGLPDTMRQYIADHTPRIGFIVGSFMAFQSLLVVAYVVYKRRRWNAPKKFL